MAIGHGASHRAASRGVPRGPRADAVDDPHNTRRFDAGTTEVLTTPASTAASEAAARPSSPSGRYLPGAEIARGGMGRVVVGTDTRLGREVAIKEALPQGGDLERFEREVRITARLEHPSIVPLYDAGVTAAGRPFYVMRKVSGQPLERLIAERSPPAGPAHRRGDADQRLALVPHVLAAANALGHAHRRGVIHRDVKPANILVGDLGETVVIDWGLAKVIGEDGVGPAPPIDPDLAPGGELATQTGAVFGTPSFMAPEQARAEALDARSDVYALGATLYHVLAGKPPLPGPLTEVLAGAHDPLRAAPALAELARLALPPELTAIVDKAMQFDPARRYPDGAALADDLNRFLAGRLVAAHRYTAAERLVRFVRRHRALVAVIAGSAIVLAGGGVLAIRGIVVERERAQHAEQAAIAGRRAAEAARERETDRADDAVIQRATAQVVRDPTSAIATLATLAPESRHWLQARAVALEARMRGIAQVYRADAPPRAFELAPDPRSLLVADGTTGRVSIIDLEHHRERDLPTGAGRCTAAWGERGAVAWIAPSAGGLYAIDVATGARRPPVTGERIEQLAADSGATQLGLALRDGRAAMLTPAGLRYLPALTGKVDEVRAAPDGSWLAFASPRELVVVDRDGRELARETDELQTATLARSTSGRKLAVLTHRGVVLELAIESRRRPRVDPAHHAGVAGHLDPVRRGRALRQPAQRGRDAPAARARQPRGGAPSPVGRPGHLAGLPRARVRRPEPGRARHDRAVPAGPRADRRARRPQRRALHRGALARRGDHVGPRRGAPRADRARRALRLVAGRPHRRGLRLPAQPSGSTWRPGRTRRSPRRAGS